MLTKLEELLSEFGETHLICDCNLPILTNDTVGEEILLYNIANPHELMAAYQDITDCALALTTPVKSLSGGQKVILLILLALYSPCERILFYQLYRSLDETRSQKVKALLAACPMQSKHIILID